VEKKSFISVSTKGGWENKKTQKNYVKNKKNM
jgi:hypothetical protein